MTLREKGRCHQLGQSSLEYLIVASTLAVALGINMASDQSVLKQLLDAFVTAYQNFSFAISLP